jgi:hypothetical protein
MRTTNPTRRPERSISPNTSEKHRAGFARSAVLTEFRARDARALDQAGFIDRPPRRLGEITNKIVAETGEKALRHWLDQAAQAETQHERAAALETAGKIAKRMNVPLADLIFGRAA